MPDRKTPIDLSEPPIDLSEYELDEATRKAVMAGPAPYNKDVDPELREKLARLKREGGSSPFLMRVAPPSVAAYVPPTELPSTGAANDSGRAAPKVEVDVPSAASELPTQPSLKRLEGEPDLPIPGLVKGASRARTQALQAPPDAGKLRLSALAVLAVLVPLLVVIVVMGRIMREQHAKDVAAAAATSTATLAMTAQPSAAPSAMATAASTAPPAPPASAVPSTGPTATASPAVPAPTGAATKRRPHGEPVDPYDAAPPATSAPSATPPAAPSTTPSAQPAAVPATTAAPAAPKPQPTVSQPDPSPLMRRKPE